MVNKFNPWHSWTRWWAATCRPWFCRRNLPYFVFLMLVAFLITTSFARHRHQPPLAAPAGGRTSSTPAKSIAFHLGQNPNEVGAAWDAMTAQENNAQAAADLPPVDPAAFVRPCQGKVLFGRGWRQEEPDGAWVYHRGVDLQVQNGNPIMSIAPGKILKVGPDEEGGTLVEVDHGSGWRSIYGRLGKVDVQTGGTITGNQAVGWPVADVVHIEIWQDSVPMDPLNVISGLG